MILQRPDRVSDALFAERLGEALDYIRKTDFLALSPGRVEIDGERLFAVVQSYDTAPAESIRFESHYNYADVQFILKGSEKILVCDISDAGTTATEYDPEGDIVFYNDPAVTPTELRLDAGQYAVFFPQDCHKTRCAPESKSVGHVNKVIVKIKL